MNKNQIYKIIGNSNLIVKLINSKDRAILSHCARESGQNTFGEERI